MAEHVPVMNTAIPRMGDGALRSCAATRAEAVHAPAAASWLDRRLNMVVGACGPRSTDAAASSATALTRLAERAAYVVLREQVVSMRVPPGSSLTVRDATAISDGRAAHVRAALDELVVDGLLETPARDEYRVTTLDVCDVEQSIEFRAVLLCAAATTCALAETRTRLLVGEAGRTAVSSGAAEALHAVRQLARFSAAVASAAGNDRLADALARTQRRLERPLMVLARQQPDVLLRWVPDQVRAIRDGCVARVRLVCEQEAAELRRATVLAAVAAGASAG